MHLGKKAFCGQGGMKANLQCCRAWVSYTRGSQSTLQLAQHRDPVMHSTAMHEWQHLDMGTEQAAPSARHAASICSSPPPPLHNIQQVLCFMAWVIRNLLSKVELDDDLILEKQVRFTPEEKHVNAGHVNNGCILRIGFWKGKKKEREFIAKTVKTAHFQNWKFSFLWIALGDWEAATERFQQQVTSQSTTSWYTWTTFLGQEAFPSPSTECSLNTSMRVKKNPFQSFSNFHQLACMLSHVCTLLPIRQGTSWVTAGAAQPADQAIEFMQPTCLFIHLTGDKALLVLVRVLITWVL